MQQHSFFFKGKKYNTLLVINIHTLAFFIKSLKYHIVCKNFIRNITVFSKKKNLIFFQGRNLQYYISVQISESEHSVTRHKYNYCAMFFSFCVRKKPIAIVFKNVTCQGTN